MKKITIGKDKSNQIVISGDDTTSRFHATLTQDSNNNIFVNDLNSTNGTYVNGIRVYKQHSLEYLDILTVGNSKVNWASYFNALNNDHSKHYTQYGSDEANIKKENYIEVIPSALYYVFIKIFIMPIIIIRKAINNIPKQKDLNTEFIVYFYIKKVYDSLLILSWPIMIIILLYNLIEENFKNFEEFLYFIALSYFIPLAISIVKETTSLLLIIAIKLEEIARNTKKN